MMSNLTIAQRKLADLKIQAMILDMDVDIETWKLVPKVEDLKPEWSKRWLDKRNQLDYDEYFDVDREEL